jgi:hypothetical protein
MQDKVLAGWVTLLVAPPVLMFIIRFAPETIPIIIIGGAVALLLATDRKGQS